MPGFRLGSEAIAELRRMARIVLREEYHSQEFGGKATREGHQDTVVVRVTTAGAVTARSGATPGSGSARVVYRTTANMLVQHSTDVITIRNLSTSTIPVNEYVIAQQDTFGSFYVPAVELSTSSGGAAPPDNSRKYAQADSGLLPGTTTGITFSVLNHTTTSGWGATTDNITVRDPDELVCYLVGERGWFKQPTTSADSWYPEAEHGLRRLIKASTTAGGIAVNGSAPGKFVINGTPTTANGTVTIENDFPGKYNRAVFQGENDIVWAQYDRTSSKWMIEPAPISQFSVGQTTTAMDPSDAASTKTGIDTWRTQDWMVNASTANGSLTAAQWSNSYDLASAANRQVLFWRSLDNALGSWAAIQADHTQLDYHTDIRVSTASGQLQVKTREVWGHTHESESTWTNKIATTTCT